MSTVESGPVVVQRSPGRRVPTRLSILIAALLAVALSVGLAVTSSLGRHVSTGLVCDNPTYDFGPVSSSHAALLQHTFSLRNTSAHPIRVLKKLTSCGCASAALASDVVAPRGAISVPVTVNWADRADTQAAIVTLVIDDATTPLLQLRLKAFVTRPITAWPRTLDFGELPPGLSHQQEFDIAEGTPAVPFTILELHPTNSDVSLARSGGGPLPGQPGRFAVRVNVPRAAGISTWQVLVKTSLSAQPIAISAVVRSTGAIAADPPSVSFHPRTNAGSVITNLRVRIVDPAPGTTLRTVITPPEESAVFHIDEFREERSGLTISATIPLYCEADLRRLHTARLRVTNGADVLDIPVIAFPTAGGSNPGPAE